MPPPKVDSQTNRQTRQDRQVPSRPGPTSTCNCTCACTCTCHLYLSQSSRFPLVCDAEQSAFLTEYDMVGVSYLKLKLPPTCQYVPSDFVYYTRTRLPSKQASKQAINRFFCCHQSASTGLVSMYCMYVQDMCVCVCVNSCIPVHIPNKHPIRPADRRRTGCFVCWLPGRLG